MSCCLPPFPAPPHTSHCSQDKEVCKRGLHQGHEEPVAATAVEGRDSSEGSDDSSGRLPPPSPPQRYVPNFRPPPHHQTILSPHHCDAVSSPNPIPLPERCLQLPRPSILPPSPLSHPTILSPLNTTLSMAIVMDALSGSWAACRQAMTRTSFSMTASSPVTRACMQSSKGVRVSHQSLGTVRHTALLGKLSLTPR